MIEAQLQKYPSLATAGDWWLYAADPVYYTEYLICRKTGKAPVPMKVID